MSTSPRQRLVPVQKLSIRYPEYEFRTANRAIGTGASEEEAQRRIRDFAGIGRTGGSKAPLQKGVGRGKRLLIPSFLNVHSAGSRDPLCFDRHASLWPSFCSCSSVPTLKRTGRPPKSDFPLLERRKKEKKFGAMFSRTIEAWKRR